MNDKILDLLAKAAEQLGVEAARLWPQIVLLTFVRSLIWAILWPVLVGLVTWGTLRWIAYCRRAGIGMDDDGPFFRMMASVFMAAFVAGIAISFLTSWPNDVAGVFFPEARTVLQLIGKS